MKNIKDFIQQLDGVRKEGNGYTARCPAHDDSSPSLSVRQVGKKLTIKCYGGCSEGQILTALGLSPHDLILEQKTGAPSHRHKNRPGRYSVTRVKHDIKTSVTQPVTAPSTGVTVGQLAQAKKIPAEFLERLGMEDCGYHHQPAVKFPYKDESGLTTGIRYRLTTGKEKGKQRFAWRKGDSTSLYGLDRLQYIREKGWVLLVDGESNAWTAWYHGIPALGIPGKSMWCDRWAKHLEGLKVYLYQKANEEDLTLAVMKSIPELMVIESKGDIEDLSDANIKCINVGDYVEQLLRSAVTAETKKAEMEQRELKQSYERARTVIESADPIELIKSSVRNLGYGGDLKPVMLTYLSATSRLLEMRNGSMPVHLLLCGPSSSGKSYTVSIVKRLLPEDAYLVIDAGSPRVVIYDKTPLKHKVLIFSEADSLPSGEDNPAAAAIHALLQEHQLRYKVTARDPKTQNFVIESIDKPGPTVLVTTSIKPLDEQLSTRIFTLEMAFDEQQIGAALEAQAKLEVEDFQPQPPEELVAFQAYLQMLAPIKASVPFARGISSCLRKRPIVPRLQRDFARIISLVKTVTIIRQHHREKDYSGRIMATLSDYAAVRELVNDAYVETTGANDNVRRLVLKLRELTDTPVAPPVSVTALATALGVNKMAASRWARKAVRENWIINNEARRGQPAKYTIGETMPEKVGLPTVEELQEAELRLSRGSDGSPEERTNKIEPDRQVKSAGYDDEYF